MEHLVTEDKREGPAVTTFMFNLINKRILDDVKQVTDINTSLYSYLIHTLSHLTDRITSRGIHQTAVFPQHVKSQVQC